MVGKSICRFFSLALFLAVAAVADDKERVLFDFASAGSLEGWRASVTKPNAKGEAGDIEITRVDDGAGGKAARFASKDAGAYKIVSPMLPKGGDWRNLSYESLEVTYKGDGQKLSARMAIVVYDAAGGARTAGSVFLFLGNAAWRRETFPFFHVRHDAPKLNLSDIRNFTIAGEGARSLEIGKISLIGGTKRLYIEPIEKPSVTVPPLAAAPVLDGATADSAWAGASVIDHFSGKDGKPAAYPTEVRLGYFGDTLYAAVWAKGEKPEEIKALRRARDTDVYNDSAVEFRFDPLDKNNEFSTYVIGANPLGTIVDIGNGSTAWNGAVKAIAAKDAKDGWRLEMAIDLKAGFNLSPVPGTVWGFNVKRHVPTPDQKANAFREVSGWSQASPGPVGGYGALVFGPLSETKARITGVELRALGPDRYAARCALTAQAPLPEIAAELTLTPPGETATAVSIAKTAAKDVPKGESVITLPFDWKSAKDGRHSLCLNLRDAAGRSIDRGEFAFNLTRPITISEDDVVLWPTPKVWKPAPGKYWLAPETVSISLSGNGDRFPAELLAERLKARYGVTVRFAEKDSDIALAYDPALKSEQFALTVTEKGAAAKAATPRGLAYAVRALLDIFAQSSVGSAPARALVCEIDDWPEIAHRAFFYRLDDKYPIGKGVPVMKDLIDEQVAGGRFNLMIFNLRDAYRYRSHPEIAARHAFARGELENILAFARRHYVDVAPGANSPGHANWITNSHPELREDGSPKVLYIRHPNALPLLKDLYGELVDLFKPKYFHLCGDEVRWETHMVPEDKRSPLSKGLEKRDLLLEHWTALAEFLRGKGVTPILWDDMLSETWNGGGVYNTAAILDKLPRHIVFAHWGKTVNAVPPEKLKALGFPKPWRISTSFAPVKVDSFLTDWREYDGAGVAEFTPWPWSNFAHYDYAKNILYSTPAIHVCAECAWNPYASSLGFDRMVALYGNHWVKTMRVPEWGTRRVAFQPFPMEGLCDAPSTFAAGNLRGWMDQSPDHDSRALPTGKFRVGGTDFVRPAAGMNCQVVSGDRRGKPIPIGEKLLGLSFLQTAAGNAEQTKALQNFILRENVTDYYSATIANYAVRYEDDTEVLIPIKMGWNVHFWDCLPAARVMPGINAFWTGLTAKQRLVDANSPDAACWVMNWVNPFPTKTIRDVQLRGAGHAMNAALMAVSGVKNAAPVELPSKR